MILDLPKFTWRYIRGLSILVLGLLAACSAQLASPIHFPVSSLRVVMDNNYPPYAFKDDQGNMQGILIDEWKLWEERTGVKVEIIGLPWEAALNRMKAGEFDVIDTIFYTDERSKIFDYTKPYASIDVRIFFQNNISGISNAENLKGFRVAVKSGDANVEYLLDKGVTSLVYYGSYEEIVQAAADNKETIFVIDQPPGLYYLYRSGIQDQFNFSEPLYGGQFHRAVKKGNSVILALVNSGFASISKKEYDAINKRWFGTSQSVDLKPIMPYLGIGISLALLIISVLTIFNRILQTRVKMRTKELAEAYDTTLEGWAKALELRDKETEGHSRRVSEITMKLARAMGVPEEDLVPIYRGAILHDIGKMAIPDEILRKADKLNPEEWEIVQRHPVIAYELLSLIPYLKQAIEIPYCHHEKWNGTGYPRGLKSEEIPLSARIFAIVDVWDAIRSDRPYNRSWPQEKAIQYLKSQSGIQFDPQVLSVFLDLLENGEI